MNVSLYENINLVPNRADLLLEYDGRFVLKQLVEMETLTIVNGIVIPTDKKNRTLLSITLANFARLGIATIPSELVVTPGDRVVPRKTRLIKQLAKGGYEVGSNSVATRKRPRSEESASERPLKKLQLDRLFRLVNVEYTFRYSIQYDRQARTDSQTGFLRSVSFSEVEERVRAIAQSFADRQAYPTVVTDVEYNTQDVQKLWPIYWTRKCTVLC